MKTLRRVTAPSLSGAIARYLDEVSRLKKGGHTEQSIARKWNATRIAGRPVDRIRNTDIIAIRDEWLADHKPSTVVRRLAFLSHLYTVLRKDWGWSELANPVQLVRRPSVDDARDRRIINTIRLRGVPESECPRSEFDWIMGATDSAEMPIIMTLAAECAMRRSEICAIERQFVWLRSYTILLPETKNGDARIVPLTPWAHEVLRRYLADKPARGRVFSMTPGAVTRAFIRARNRARARYEGLCAKYGRKANPDYFRDLRLHDLRHEGTSRLAPIFELHDLAKITGHNDTRMLLRYYHPDGRELARKIARSPLGREQIARIKKLRDAS